MNVYSSFSLNDLNMSMNNENVGHQHNGVLTNCVALLWKLSYYSLELYQLSLLSLKQNFNFIKSLHVVFSSYMPHRFNSILLILVDFMPSFH